jgi:hypothetical protein
LFFSNGHRALIKKSNRKIARFKMQKQVNEIPLDAKELFDQLIRSESQVTRSIFLFG